jgi:hypothetical protein
MNVPMDENYGTYRTSLRDLEGTEPLSLSCIPTPIDDIVVVVEWMSLELWEQNPCIATFGLRKIKALEEMHT